MILVNTVILWIYGSLLSVYVILLRIMFLGKQAVNMKLDTSEQENLLVNVRVKRWKF